MWVTFSFVTRFGTFVQCSYCSVILQSGVNYLDIVCKRLIYLSVFIDLI